MKVDKNLVKDRFFKSVSSYRDNSSIQDEMSLELVKIVKKKCGVDFPEIVEVGCGTGSLTENIIKNLKFDKLFLNDIVEESADYIKENIFEDFEFVGGDAEIIDIPRRKNLYLSNAVIQWFNDVDSFFERLQSSILRDSIIAFSSFGPGNLNEIFELTGKGLSYQPVSLLKEILRKYFDILYFYDYEKKLLFDSPTEVLRHLKNTGVTGLSKEKWTKGRFEKLRSEYIKRFSDGNKVYLTYHPILFVARGKSE